MVLSASMQLSGYGERFTPVRCSLFGGWLGWLGHAGGIVLCFSRVSISSVDVRCLEFELTEPRVMLVSSPVE